jgi:tRNA dimethylallyltransferase
MPTAAPKPLLIMLMGPTASGKTDVAMALSKLLPVDIISVDSTLVYQGLNIGSAKPTLLELAAYPHRLIDICDPAEPYSAASFCRDAKVEITIIANAGRIPLLVGGSMMYFKSLVDGLADMPESNPAIRQAITAEAAAQGWPAMHEQLKAIDPEYAAKLHPNHSQRISRALEVFRDSGITMTQYRHQQHRADAKPKFLDEFTVITLGLLPDDRVLLHERIFNRFHTMLKIGFVEEVEALRAREDLHLALPSMRAVGYRQIWQYLDGDFNYITAIDKGVAATRQLAKRQLTWLRNWPEVVPLPVDKIHSELLLQKKVKLILSFLPARYL